MRARAHAIWERLGRPKGAADGHWSRAEGGGTANPGDDAPPGTPGTGEGLCQVCHGTGRVNGRACSSCGGYGKVIAGIGGA